MKGFFTRLFAIAAVASSISICTSPNVAVASQVNQYPEQTVLVKDLDRSFPSSHQSEDSSDVHETIDEKSTCVSGANYSAQCLSTAEVYDAIDRHSEHYELRREIDELRAELRKLREPVKKSGNRGKIEIMTGIIKKEEGDTSIPLGIKYSNGRYYIGVQKNEKERYEINAGWQTDISPRDALNFGATVGAETKVIINYTRGL